MFSVKKIFLSRAFIEYSYLEIVLFDIGSKYVSKVANRQNPVGPNNSNKNSYLQSADEHLNSNKLNNNYNNLTCKNYKGSIVIHVKNKVESESSN